MRIFVAGATGAIGRRLVPILVAAGHNVTGMTRTSARSTAIGDMGAMPAILDAFDRDAVLRALRSGHLAAARAICGFPSRPRRITLAHHALQRRDPVYLRHALRASAPRRRHRCQVL